MKDTVLSRALRISDTRVAAALADPLRRRLVLLLAGQERALAEMARTIELDLKRLHYHVGALCKLGLVAVTGVRRRAGRPVKLYRAVSEAFFVPAEIMAAGPAEALAAQLRDSLAALRGHSREGVLYYRSEDGALQMRAVRHPAAKHVPAAEFWRILRLSRADAIRLAKDIEDRLKTYGQNRHGKEDTYLVHFAFAPSGAPAPTRARTPAVTQRD